MFYKMIRVLEEERALQIAETLRGMPWREGFTKSKAKSIKKNQEIRADDGLGIDNLLKEISDRIRDHAIWSDQLIKGMAEPRFNCYRDGGAYDEHSDAAFMGKQVITDLACTLFLSDGFSGGELVINNVRFTCKPGVAIVYDCWRPHKVTPVTSGDRIAFLTWFESWVQDSTKRELLNSLHSVAVRATNQKDFAELGAVHEQLVKMWAR